MNQIEFDELHTSCVNAFDNYVTAAELTATLLEKCTPDPLPLADRLSLMVQERAEEHAHSVYLGAKRVLHDSARLGFHYAK